MDLKRIAKDTAKVLTSYLTYQAVRTVMMQLRETNLPLSYWLNEFATRDKLQDGELFLEGLLQEQPELALRVMTVRFSFGRGDLRISAGDGYHRHSAGQYGAPEKAFRANYRNVCAVNGHRATV